MIRFLLLIALLLAGPLARGQNPLSIHEGERLTFRVGWGLFPNAGTITILAEEADVAGLPHTKVVTETATRGFIRLIYPFDGRVESLFDPQSGRILSAHARTSAGRKHTQASVVFDYADGQASYVDALRPERSTEIEMPEGYPMDLITSLVNTRSWDIEVGEERPLTVLFDDEFYELMVTAERIETIHTAEGRREAMLLVPRMEGEPKGMFRKGGEVRVWLSTDEPRLPLRLEVKLAVGTATALLTDYQPAADDDAAPVSAVHASSRS